MSQSREKALHTTSGASTPDVEARVRGMESLAHAASIPFPLVLIRRHFNRVVLFALKQCVSNSGSRELAGLVAKRPGKAAPVAFWSVGYSVLYFTRFLVFIPPSFLGAF